MNKLIKKVLIAFLVLIVFLTVFYHAWLKHRYVVPILMYHSIVKVMDGVENESLYVSVDNFKRQMGYLRWRGYNVISLDELVKGIKEGRKFKRNTVVITFDDGYEDNYVLAYPVLSELGFPATIFLISDYIGKEASFLSWEQAKVMLAGNKIDFGAHTKNNTYLPDVKDKIKLTDEIVGSKRQIEQNLGKNVEYFCYPTGGFTPEAKKLIKETGYKGACTTNRGFVKFNKDVYELKRIKIKNSDFSKKPLSFWAKLSGYYNIVRKGKNPY